MENVDKQQNRKKEFLFILIMFVTYVIQFIICPIILPEYISTNTKGAAVLYLATMMSAFIIGGCFISLNMNDWLKADIVYLVLITIYSADGAYGFDYNSYLSQNNNNFVAIIAAVSTFAMIVFVSQSLTLRLVSTIKKLKK